jgi:hypothetical protein
MSATKRFPPRATLTAEESAMMMPKYVERQTKAKEERTAKAKIDQRAKVEMHYKHAKAEAETEYHGMIWLLDHDINIENCIFYAHTGQFSFGWRSPVDPEVKSKLQEILTEFPYSYDIKSK